MNKLINKKVAIFFATALCISCIGCGSSSETEDAASSETDVLESVLTENDLNEDIEAAEENTESVTAETENLTTTTKNDDQKKISYSEEENSEEERNDAVFVSQVIADTDEFTIELTGNDISTETEFRVELLITNKTDDYLNFSGDVAAVNGVAITGEICNTSVPANSSETSYFYAEYYKIEHFGLIEPHSITFDFTVVDTSDTSVGYYGIFYYDTVTVDLYGDAYDDVADPMPESTVYEILYEDDNIYIGFCETCIEELGVPAEERFVVPLLIMNKTENNMRVTASPVYLNEIKTTPTEQVVHLPDYTYTWLLLGWNDEMLEELGMSMDTVTDLCEVFSAKISAYCCEQNFLSENAEDEYLNNEEITIYMD